MLTQKKLETKKRQPFIVYPEGFPGPQLERLRESNQNYSPSFNLNYTSRGEMSDDEYGIPADLLEEQRQGAERMQPRRGLQAAPAVRITSFFFSLFFC